MPKRLYDPQFQFPLNTYIYVTLNVLSIALYHGLSIGAILFFLG